MVDIHVSVYIIIHLSLTYVIQTLKSLLQRKSQTCIVYLWIIYIIVGNSNSKHVDGWKQKEFYSSSLFSSSILHSSQG